MMSPTLLLSVLAMTADRPFEENVPLRLGEVLRSVAQFAPALEAAEADVRGAQAEQLTSEGAFDPLWRTRGWNVATGSYPQTRVDSVVEAPTSFWGTTFFGGYRLGLGKIQPYYGERETWSAGELRAGATIPLIRNGPIDRRRANVARAELGLSMAGLSKEQQSLELTKLASIRYWEWIAAGRRRSIVRSLLEIAQMRDRQLAIRSKAGDVAEFDRQENTRALIMRQGLSVAAQRSLEQSAFELSLYLRDASGNPVIPDESRLGSFDDPSTLPDDSVEVALARRPEVKRLIDQRQQIDIELRLQKNQLLPAFDLGFAVSGDIGNAARPAAASLGPTEFEVNAMLDVPLLFRAATGRIQVVEASRVKLESQLRLTRDRITIEISDLRSAARAANERIVLARQEVELSAQLEQGERSRFELGDSTLFVVNLREQATAEAQLREVDAVADWHRANAALMAALAIHVTQQLP